MFAAFFNWLTKKGGWKIFVYCSVIVLVVFGIVTGVIYYFFGGGTLIAFERIFSLFEKDQKQREWIEEQKKKEIRKEKHRYHQEEKRINEQREEEKKRRIERYPKEKTARELEEEIENLLDRSEKKG